MQNISGNGIYKILFIFGILFLVFIFLLNLVLIQIISSFQVINADQDENKFDDLRQIPNSPYYPSLPNNGKQGNAPDCVPKSILSNMLSRDRRASISRPYFYLGRRSGENGRYISKNLLAFSPRLGKRSYENEVESPIRLNKREIDEDNNTPDLDLFLANLVDHLQSKRNDVVYEDSTKVCFSDTVNEATVKEVLEKLDSNRRQQEEEARERQSKGKHPLLFRYRLG